MIRKINEPLVGTVRHAVAMRGGISKLTDQTLTVMSGGRMRKYPVQLNCGTQTVKLWK